MTAHADTSHRYRFAPSPTGALHIGGARTALYNWLAARHAADGRLILRIEDTDRERSTTENVDQILDAMEWLGLTYDEGPISQAGRADRHGAALEQLLASGAAYRDSATGKDVEAWKKVHGAGRGYRGTPTEEPRRRDPPARPRRRRDDRRGRHPRRPSPSPTAPTTTSSSPAPTARSSTTSPSPSTTPRWASPRSSAATTTSPTRRSSCSSSARSATSRPRYAHLPLLHGPDGKKLSKRHGAASVQELRDAGYLPAAVRNYLALLGWGTDDDTTLMSTEELIRRFEVADVGRSAAIFDEKKLRWLNGRFMREMPLDEYTLAVARHVGREPDERLRDACAIAQDKAQTLEEVWPLIRFLYEPPVDDPKSWDKVMKEGTGEMLDAAAGAGTRGASVTGSGYVAGLALGTGRSRRLRRWPAADAGALTSILFQGDGGLDQVGRGRGCSGRRPW